MGNKREREREGETKVKKKTAERAITDVRKIQIDHMPVVKKSFICTESLGPAAGQSAS